MAAAIGLGQLPQLDAFNARRRELARRYFERWDRSLGFELPPADLENHGNWHMFQPLLPRALAAKRGAFIEAMKARGIGIGVHYPAMHLFALFRAHGPRAGRFSGRRGHRRAHRDAAAVPGHDRRRRRPRLRGRDRREHARSSSSTWG